MSDLALFFQNMNYLKLILSVPEENGYFSKLNKYPILKNLICNTLLLSLLLPITIMSLLGLFHAGLYIWSFVN